MFNKIKVDFRIREHYDCENNQLIFIPEAKNYLYFYGDDGWIDISCNCKIGYDYPILDKDIAQTAIDNTRRLIENYGQKRFKL